MVGMQVVGGAGMISCGVAGLWDAQGHWELRVVRISGQWSGLVSGVWPGSRGVG